MESGNLFGFLNIYKPVGMTSHDVVSVLRRVTKIKQIGHTGTLDPFAEGVLPIAIGKATRLIEYLDDYKAYIGRFNFGKSTSTYDIEGDVENVYDEKADENSIIDKLTLFKGEIEQIPPMYSAKKINGKKMYELARAGVAVELKPCNVTVYDIKLLNFDEEEQWADIYIKCSKGTYIRSIANDLGKSLNNGCYLSKLQRVTAGLFNIENAIRLDDIKTVKDVEENLLNPIKYLPYQVQELNEQEHTKISHGMPIENNSQLTKGCVILTKNDELIAIAEISGAFIKAKKVFV